MRLERLSALADGIFAIALTLLVLELPLPHDSAHLTSDLLSHWPSYLAYVVSFVTVGIIWVNHHSLFSALAPRDLPPSRTFMELNLLLLLFVSVIPWPTGLLAEYLTTSQARPAALVYSVVLGLMSASFTLLWRFLAHHPSLLLPHVPTSRALRRSYVGPLAYLVSTLLALLSPLTSFLLCMAIALFFALSARRTSSPDPAS